MAKSIRWSLSILVLIGACAFSAAVAFGNFYYYQWINSFFKVHDVFLSALLFSSFLIILSFLIIIWNPGFFGYKLGDSIKKWKQVLFVTIALSIFTIVCLLLTPRTPYSGVNWAVETILVPVCEESMWRGVIFALIYMVLGKLHNDKQQFVFTIVYSSIAFGLAHISNVLVYPFSFVGLQMIFAAIAGAAMGYIRAKTDSVYPSIFVHAVFNLIAILF